MVNTSSSSSTNQTKVKKKVVESLLTVLYGDVVHDSEKIVSSILQAGFHLVHRVTVEDMRKDYAEILTRQFEDFPFHDNISKVLCDSPCTVLILSKVDGINTMHSLLGPQNPFVARKTSPTSVRALYGTDEVNCAAFASRNISEALEEIELFYPFHPISNGGEGKDWVLQQLMPVVAEGLSQLALQRPNFAAAAVGGRVKGSAGGGGEDAFSWMAKWIHDYHPEVRYGGPKTMKKLLLQAEAAVEGRRGLDDGGEDVASKVNDDEALFPQRVLGYLCSGKQKLVSIRPTFSTPKLTKDGQEAGLIPSTSPQSAAPPIHLQAAIEGRPELGPRWWNFRQVRGGGLCPVFGMGQGTKDGIQTVLRAISSSGGHSSIVMVDTREDAFLFVGGTPTRLVIMDGDENTNGNGPLKLLANDEEEIQRLEKRMKKDLLEDYLRGEPDSDDPNAYRMLIQDKEANKKNFIPVMHHQSSNNNEPESSLILLEHHVDHPLDARVETLEEIYKTVGVADVSIKSRRVPCPSSGKLAMDSSSGAEVFDALLEIMVSEIDSFPAFVVSSATGVNHSSSVAMTALCVYWRIRSCLGSERGNNIGSEESSTGAAALVEDRPNLSVLKRSVSQMMQGKTSERNLVDLAEYSTIVDLQQLLGSNGPLAKRILDAAIDECCEGLEDPLQHLRKCIFLFHQQTLRGGDQSQKAEKHHQLDAALRALERYYWLLVFSAFLVEKIGPGGSGDPSTYTLGDETFSEWLEEHYELQGLILNPSFA